MRYATYKISINKSTQGMCYTVHTICEAYKKELNMYRYKEMINAWDNLMSAFNDHKYITSLLFDVDNIAKDFIYNAASNTHEKLEYEPTLRQLTNWAREEEGSFDEKTAADLLSACDTIWNIFECWNND